MKIQVDFVDPIQSVSSPNRKVFSCEVHVRSRKAPAQEVLEKAWAQAREAGVNIDAVGHVIHR